MIQGSHQGLSGLKSHQQKVLSIHLYDSLMTKESKLSYSLVALSGFFSFNFVINFLIQVIFRGF